MDLLLLFAAEVAPVEVPALTLEVRIPLSIMNFLQFAIWGAWFVVLGQYLNSLKFSGAMIGSIYGTMALGTIISPLLVGSLADRYVNSEHLMAASHLIGAVLLVLMSQIKKPGAFFWTALLYAIVYGPTVSLCNSISNAHADPGRDGPSLRVLGTIGWIAANLLLKFLLKPNAPVNNRPLLLAAAFSTMLGIYSFMLPETKPPMFGQAIEGIDSLLPALKALKSLSNPEYAAFFGISFLITIGLAFYYGFTSLFLEQKIGVRSDNVGPLMTIGQWSEMIFLLALPFFIKSFGHKNVILIGMAAWALRYFVFTAGGPFPLIVASLALHGICYDFFFQTGFIYVAESFDKEIAGSASALYVMITYGVGMFLGNAISGWLHTQCTTETTDSSGQMVRSTNWSTFWLIPAVGVSICLVAFVLLFPSKGAAPAQKAAPAEQAETVQ